MDGVNILRDQVPAAAAPKAGGDLRAARERLGWPLQDVSATLRIRRSYLEALEDGDLSQLPGNAYALGFLRSYACALGLDPEEMLRRFKAEAADVSQRTELSFPAPVPERGLPTGAVILLGLILAVGTYIGWYRLSGEGRLPAETAATIPERLTPLAEQALPPSVTPPVREATTAAAPGLPTISPTISPISAAAAPVNPEPEPAPPATVVPAANPVVLSTQTGPRVIVRTNGDAWLEVRDKTGAVLLNKVLHQGDTWPVPPTTGLTLTTGNAAVTEILLDGVAVGTLGGAGSVRHDIPLDVDQLKTGKPAGAAPRPAQ